MLLAITCPACGHHGYIDKRKLPRILVCSACGHRARFEREHLRRGTTGVPSQNATLNDSQLSSGK
jgi:transcription elongation factor Elf1